MKARRWKKGVNALADAGCWMGRTAGDTLSTVDPDVYRHLAQVPLLAYTLFPPKKKTVLAGKSDGNAPLVFVHGLAGNCGNFRLMSAYLWLTGRKRSYSIDFKDRSISKMSDQLAQFIEQIVHVTGEPKVEIVAYSRGGVVSRLAIAKQSLESLVKTLITLGTPHSGTFPARYANTPLTRELLPNSAVFRELSKYPWPKKVRGVTFWSKNDLLIYPPEGAAMKGTLQVDVSPFTHFSYLVSPRSWELVRRALNRESPLT